MSNPRPASTSASIFASLASVCFDNQTVPDKMSVSKIENGRGSNWNNEENAALLAIWGRANVQARFDGSVRDQKTYMHISSQVGKWQRAATTVIQFK